MTEASNSCLENYEISAFILVVVSNVASKVSKVSKKTPSKTRDETTVAVEATEWKADISFNAIDSIT